MKIGRKHNDKEAAEIRKYLRKLTSGDIKNCRNSELAFFIKDDLGYDVSAETVSYYLCSIGKQRHRIKGKSNKPAVTAPKSDTVTYFVVDMENDVLYFDSVGFGLNRNGVDAAIKHFLDEGVSIEDIRVYEVGRHVPVKVGI